MSWHITQTTITHMIWWGSDLWDNPESEGSPFLDILWGHGAPSCHTVNTDPIIHEKTALLTDF